MKKYLRFFMAVMLALTAVSYVYAEEDVETSLSNGMKVFIKPMRAAPVVTVSFWIKNGSVYESDGESGFSELVSKMLFANSLNFSNYALAGEIKKLGIKYERCTANDCQAYSLTGSSLDFKRILELGADGFFNSIFTEDDLKRAISETQSEIMQAESDPMTVVDNLMLQEAFTTHPCRRPYYGLNPDYSSANPFIINRYYKRSYSPSNSTLIITGDVDSDLALDEIKRLIEPVKDSGESEVEMPKEPVQVAYREVVKYADIKKVYVSFGWKVPGYNSPDRYALYVVGKMLGGSEDSILWTKEVAGRQTAEYVSATYASSRFESLLQANGITTRSKVQYFIDGVKKNVSNLIDEPISDDFLEEVKKSIINEDTFNCEGVTNSALNYGSFAIVAEPGDAEAFAAGIASVNKDDIRRVTAEYLRDDRLTVAILEAAPIAEDAAPKMMTLENGLKLIMKENHSSPVVAVSCKFSTGALRDTKGMAGQAYFTAEMLNRSLDSDGKGFVKKINKLGSKVSYDVTKDYTDFSMKSVASSFIPSFELFIKMLSNAEMSLEVSKSRDVVESLLKQENENIERQNELNVLKSIYGTNSVAFSDYGKSDDLAKLKKADITDFYKKNYVASGTVISVVGDFYTTELEDFLLASVGKISNSKNSSLKPVEIETYKTDAPVTFRQKKSEKAYIAYISPSINVSNESRLPLELGCRILNNSLRNSFVKADNTGLMSNSVRIANVSYTTDGYFMAKVATVKDNVATAAQLLALEIEAFKMGGIDMLALDAAKAEMIGEYSLKLTDCLSLAKTFSEDEFLGNGFDNYAKYATTVKGITPEQVKNAVKAYMLVDKKYLIGVASDNVSDLIIKDNKLVLKEKESGKTSKESDKDKDNEKSKSKDKSKK